MPHNTISQDEALAMLCIWRDHGHNLPSLMKISSNHSDNELYLLIPGYQCNEWYRLGEQFSNFKEAFSAYGTLLDLLDSSKAKFS